MQEPSSYWSDLSKQFDEKVAIKELDQRIQKQESAVTLCRRLLALRGQPGYEPFVEAIKGIRSHALRELCSPEATDQKVRVAQGQVRAYDNILAIVSDTDEREKALDRALTELREQRKLLGRPTSMETKR